MGADESQRKTSACGTKRNCRGARIFPELGVDRLQHQPAGTAAPDPKRPFRAPEVPRYDVTGVYG